MSYKCSRILIAEEQPKVHSRIEKTLNELGYRTLTRAGSLRELLALTHYSHEPFEHFDLMIINGELMASASVDPVQFFQNISQVRHAVIHDAYRGQPEAELLYANVRRQLNLIQTPDRQALVALLAKLDL
jgi:hypothetical protein